jgi:hypothetical protein
MLATVYVLMYFSSEREDKKYKCKIVSVSGEGSCENFRVQKVEYRAHIAMVPK